MHTTQISGLENTRQLVDALGKEETSVIVREDGSPAAYLLSPQAYETLQNRVELLKKINEGLASGVGGHTYTQAEVETMFKEKFAKWRT